MIGEEDQGKKAKAKRVGVQVIMKFSMKPMQGICALEG